MAADDTSQDKLVGEIRRAFDAFKSEQQQKNRMQFIFTLVILVIFVGFAVILANRVRAFDQKEFSSRIEKGVSDSAPFVLKKLGESSKTVVAALVDAANKEMPYFQAKLSAQMAEQTGAFRDAAANMNSFDSSPVIDTYLSSTFKGVLTEAVPELSKGGKVDKLMSASNKAMAARARVTLEEEMKGHLVLLDDIQDNLVKLSAEAPKHRNSDSVQNEILMATLDVMKARIASGESLEVEKILAPIVGGGQ